MLKYQDKLSSINNCPSSDSSPIDKKGYRFVFEGLGGNSFSPLIVQQPIRSYKNNYQKCSSCGLSMYSTESQAKAKFADLLKRNRNIYKSIGNKLALVKITPQLGLCTRETSTGHFDFYEYHDCELKLFSSVVGDLI